MTFGTDWGWAAERDEARRIFDTYVDRGGNFIDTSNNSPTARPSGCSASSPPRSGTAW
jgi:aryl-alcohol dehydrogenase-like predicted oxidoreductase